MWRRKSSSHTIIFLKGPFVIIAKRDTMVSYLCSIHVIVHSCLGSEFLIQVYNVFNAGFFSSSQFYFFTLCLHSSMESRQLTVSGFGC